MNENEYRQYSKLDKGELGYIIPSTRLSEGKVGIVVDIDDADPPHFKLRFLDGSISRFLDYKTVGAGGRPPRPVASGIKATVKWVYDPAIDAAPPKSIEHREWDIEQISDEFTHHDGLDNRWIMVRDEWTGRQHWLCTGSIYSFMVSGNAAHRVELEGIPRDL